MRLSVLTMGILLAAVPAGATEIVPIPTIVSLNQLYVDEIRVVSSDNINLVPNGSFDDGLTGWTTIPFIASCQFPEIAISCFGPIAQVLDGATAMTSVGSVIIEQMFAAIDTDTVTSFMITGRVPGFEPPDETHSPLNMNGLLYYTDGRVQSWSTDPFTSTNWQTFDLFRYVRPEAAIVGLDIFTMDPDVRLLPSPEPGTGLLLIAGLFVWCRRVAHNPQPKA